MQIRFDTCECHPCNRPPFTIPGMYETRRGDGHVVSPSRDRYRGRNETNGRYSGPNPYFSRPTHNCPFLGGKMHATRRSQTAKPARPSPLIKSPDSVKKDCMARKGARFGRRRFSISLYTAFQMMTEIKHTLWCRSLRLPVVCPVGGGGAEVCVERDCGELFLFRPPPPRLPRPTDAAPVTTILATFSRPPPSSLPARSLLLV